VGAEGKKDLQPDERRECVSAVSLLVRVGVTR
jgi:hypothetical protein